MKHPKKSNDSPKPKMGEKKYLKELRKLQIELCKLQDWVKSEGQRIIVLMEGRDGAGKGGTIKAITERVSPRVFRVVALPAPSDLEKTQMYMQRYIQHFPAAGEIVILDRSWYNRGGVEYVMGFCSKREHRRFLELCPVVERWITEDGIRLIKFWLEVSNQEQKRPRIEDPLRQWKLSPTDLPSRSRWFEYSRARDTMGHRHRVRALAPRPLRRQETGAPQLHLPFLEPDSLWARSERKGEAPKRSMKRAYDDEATLKNRRFVPERY